RALRSKEGEAFANVWDLARHYTAALLDDWRRLGLREPTVRPRATEHVREQILAVARLVEAGYAYETDDGVYFHVPAFPDYGKLSGNTDAERLDVGAAAARRAVVVDEGKRDPRDFALWKKDDAHLMQWHSPFGQGPAGGWGFPGWHLECSVMAQQYLGETIDLHGGGEDLRFPHHECEIAQAEALSGKPFARMW
ncbi:MAG: cysteine--tRNA ligase, partial [Dietzia cercidiphylli]